MLKLGDWYFLVRAANRGDGYIAWCAKTPDLGSGPMDVDFSEVVYFEFGDTPEAAMRKLTQEVLN